jgi:hypothetical protein
MADDLMREIAPLLAEDGIDLNDPGSIPDMSVLQRALDRAIERRNMALFATIRAGRWSAAGRPSTAPRTATPPFDKHRTRIHVHRILIGMPERSGSRSPIRSRRVHPFTGSAEIRSSVSLRHA